MLSRPLIATSPCPIHDTRHSRALELEAQAALPDHALMQRAAHALAKLALALRPAGGSIGVLCGPGNNGGDGLAAATLLNQAGVPVQAYLETPSDRHPADARWALNTARQSGLRLTDRLPAADERHALWIDALLGLGLSRPPEGWVAQGIERLCQQDAPILSVDLPSGLCSDTGQALGPWAVTATHTLCLLSLKPGLLTGQGRSHCGEIWFDDIGVAGHEPIQARLGGFHLLQDWRQAMAQSAHSAHKGKRGDVLVVGGAPGMQGAARLAARASLASGAGRTYLCLLDGRQDIADADRAELMHWPVQQLGSDASHPSATRTWQDMTLVVGCGAGLELADHLHDLLEHAPRLVLDADGLNAVASCNVAQQRLRERTARGLPTILTPHPLEAARLLGCNSQDVQADRLRMAQTLADDMASVVILKGSGSVIAAPGLRPWINGSGHSALATPGTGDVLAGWLGGLWAQSQASGQAQDQSTLQQLAATAAYWHGRAAQAQTAGPMRAADLVEQMHRMHAPPQTSGPA